MKKALANSVLVVASLLVTLLICEMAARLILKPVDYLSVTTEKDAILGHRIPPRSSGHDAWGFRNPGVPQSADIVTIGDSHTYGNKAKMNESWPYVLQQATSQRVYNLGMGGYGPNQYLYLLENKALRLNPQLIMVGLYLGDDLDNAHSITYGLDHWEYLRDYTIRGSEASVWAINIGTRFGKRVRHWFSCHSVLYQIVVHGPVLGWLRARMQIASARNSDDNIAVLTIEEKNIAEAFIPAPVLPGVDLERETTSEGLRITLKLIEQMSMRCRQRSIRFVVVLIPTKETVYSKYLLHNSSVRLHGLVDQVILGERVVRQVLLESFTKLGIECVDTLADLQQSIDREKLYASGSSDMHPNKNGYRVIGESVARYLDMDSTDR